MDFKLTPAQLQKLQGLYLIMQALEADMPEEPCRSNGKSTSKSSHEALLRIDPLIFEDLQRIFLSLEQEDSLILKKLGALRQHLQIEMPHRQFSNLVVPIERALKRNVQDDDFLVTTSDALTVDGPLEKQEVPLIFVLENIRSAFNVGSFFRTADCLGAKKIVLTGYTARPEQSKVERTAMGTTNFTLWESTSKTSEALKQLRDAGYYLIAVETSPKSQGYSSTYERRPTVFVFGNERHGLEADILALCDEVRSIPVFGVKNSLNVGIAAGIIGYEWRRQYDEGGR